MRGLWLSKSQHVRRRCISLRHLSSYRKASSLTPFRRLQSSAATISHAKDLRKRETASNNTIEEKEKVEIREEDRGEEEEEELKKAMRRKRKARKGTTRKSRRASSKTEKSDLGPTNLAGHETVSAWVYLSLKRALENQRYEEALQILLQARKVEDAVNHKSFELIEEYVSSADKNDKSSALLLKAAKEAAKFRRMENTEGSTDASGSFTTSHQQGQTAANDPKPGKNTKSSKRLNRKSQRKKEILYYKSTGDWKEALRVVSEMESEGRTVSLKINNALLTALSQSGKWQEAQEVVTRMQGKASKLQPNEFTHSKMLLAFANAKEWDRAEEYFKTSCDASPCMYNFLAYAMAHGGNWTRVTTTLERMKKAGLPPDTLTYSLIIKAFVESKQHDGVDKAIGLMRAENVVPDEMIVTEMVPLYPDAMAVLRALRDKDAADDEIFAHIIKFLTAADEIDGSHSSRVEAMEAEILANKRSARETGDQSISSLSHEKDATQTNNPESQTTEEDVTTKLNRLLKKAIEKVQYDEALQIFRKALTVKNAVNHQTFQLIQRCLTIAGKYNESLSLFKLACSRDMVDEGVFIEAIEARSAVSEGTRRKMHNLVELRGMAQSLGFSKDGNVLLAFMKAYNKNDMSKQAWACYEQLLASVAEIKWDEGKVLTDQNWREMSARAAKNAPELYVDATAEGMVAASGHYTPVPALSLLSFLIGNSMEDIYTTRLLNVSMRAFLDSDYVAECIQFYEKCMTVDHPPPPDIETYGLVMRAYGRAQEKASFWKTFDAFMRRIKAERKEANQATMSEYFLVAFEGLQHMRKYAKILSMFDDMDDELKTREHFTIALGACKNLNYLEKGIEILRHMEQGGFSVSQQEYETLLDVCSKMKISMMQPLVQEMEGKGLQRSLGVYDAMIKACTTDHDWEAALELLQEMGDKKIRVDHKIASKLIVIFGCCNKWDILFEVLEMCKREGIEEPSVFMQAIHMCSKNKRIDMISEILVVSPHEGEEKAEILLLAMDVCFMAGEYQLLSQICDEFEAIEKSALSMETKKRADLAVRRYRIVVAHAHGEYKEALHLFNMHSLEITLDLSSEVSLFDANESSQGRELKLSNAAIVCAHDSAIKSSDEKMRKLVKTVARVVWKSTLRLNPAGSKGKRRKKLFKERMSALYQAYRDILPDLKDPSKSEEVP